MKTGKSFEGWLTKEDVLQSQIVTYLNLQYPNLFWMHPVNEGRRTPFEQYKAKKLGITSGIPDLLIFAGTGLAIELKVGKNKPTDNQIICMKKLTDAGWTCKVCYSFDEAKREIDTFLKQGLKAA